MHYPPFVLINLRSAELTDCKKINPVLTMGAVFIGYLCALLAYLYLEFTNVWSPSLFSQLYIYVYPTTKWRRNPC